MNIAVCMAWRTDEAERERSYQFVLDWLAEAGQRAVVLGDSGHFPFNRAASRNKAAEHAIREGADVLIFHDADMIVPRVAYRQAADLAWREKRLVVAFSEYRALGPAESLQVIKGNEDPFTARPAGKLKNWSLGGIVAVTADGWAKVGGYDTRFHGWGCEDTAFAVACGLILGGPTLRTENAGVHLWHEHGTTTTNRYMNEHNGRLLAAYNQCPDLAAYIAMRSSELYEWTGVEARA